MAVATSSNLTQWTKHGAAFSNTGVAEVENMKYLKSASILCRMKKGKLVAAKLHGKYWMYWGERFVSIATSNDLIHWQPMTTPEGTLLKVMLPRRGHFDSIFTECGPPALLTDHGILLFYNGKNAAQNGDPNYPAGSYSAGQALFSRRYPEQLLDRLPTPFLTPERDYEKSGQYPQGTVFIQGLVPHQGQWFLYYGCADSRIGVAVKK